MRFLKSPFEISCWISVSEPLTLEGDPPKREGWRNGVR